MARTQVAPELVASTKVGAAHTRVGEDLPASDPRLASPPLQISAGQDGAALAALRRTALRKSAQRTLLALIRPESKCSCEKT